MPAIFRWPGQIPAGKTSAQVGIVMDLTATILAVTKSPVPAGGASRGHQPAAAAEGRRQRVERTLFFRYTLPARRQRAVRQGDWKLMLDGANPMLFNLKDDVGERNDLANQRMDIVRKLFPLIGQWEQDVDAEAKQSASSQ